MWRCGIDVAEETHLTPYLVYPPMKRIRSDEDSQEGTAMIQMTLGAVAVAEDQKRRQAAHTVKPIEPASSSLLLECPDKSCLRKLQHWRATFAVRHLRTVLPPLSSSSSLSSSSPSAQAPQQPRRARRFVAAKEKARLPPSTLLLTAPLLLRRPCSSRVQLSIFRHHHRGSLGEGHWRAAHLQLVSSTCMPRSTRKRLETAKELLRSSAEAEVSIARENIATSHTPHRQYL